MPCKYIFEIMAVDCSRREILRTILIGVGGGLAGCSDLNPVGCADHRAVTIRVNKTTNVPNNPLQTSELPKNQKYFLKEAIDDGEFRECPTTKVENEEALHHLAVTVRERRDSIEKDNIYLEHEETYYIIELFQIDDEVYT